MSSIIEKRRALLEETAAHFNADNRSAMWGVSCVYSPVNGGEGCAIGRKIADKELCAQLDSLPQPGAADIRVFNRFPEELKELGQDFLCDVQNLHDIEQNWNHAGLSEMGQRNYDKAIKKFCTLP